ncbi:MAG: hypothetical protein RLZZ490_21 [Cyanobacteriota bacterium]|jgi:putative PIN family toxin of toxin-antitoxin system
MSRRYVFDTNVLVSAVLSAHSVPRQAFNSAFTTGTILMSYSIVNELNEVLSRPKFRRYLSAEKRDIFLWSLFRKARFIDVIKEKIDICRDAKDNQFLELAVNGEADFIISGDDDLLVLNPFGNTLIVTPRIFLDRFS